MCEKSEMELIYDQYLLSDDNVIEADGLTYYKIIRKDRISLNNGIVLICLPSELFENGVDKVIDEYGNVLKIGSPVFYSFGGRVPDWYLNTITVNVCDIHEINQIGDYVAAI